MSRKRKTTSKYTPPPVLTTRDDLILSDIFEHGGLTATQIAALHYPPDGDTTQRVFPVAEVSSNCRRRITQFSNSKFLEQRERLHTGLGEKEQIHRLSKSGIALLATRLGLTVEELLLKGRQIVPKGDLEHFILINDVWIALKIAAARHGATIVRWISDSEFKREPLVVPPDGTRDNKKAQEFVPDGYFHLQIEQNKQRTIHRFIEVDRGSEAGTSSNPLYTTWAKKVELYQAYHDSGAYQKRFHTHQMAILTVTTSEQRLANLKRVTENAGGESWFWFTTFDKAKSEAILTTAIWQLAGKTGLAPMVWEEGEEPPLSK